jgi:uncharacterized membrane protein
VAVAGLLLACHAAHALPPQYSIQDLGVVQTGDSASEAFGVSLRGLAVGRSLRSGGSQAFSWTQASGLVGLPNLAGRAYCVARAANDDGRIVGSCSTTADGSDRVPVAWQNGPVSQLALPPMQTTGDAHALTRSLTVGSVNTGGLERAADFGSVGSRLLTATTSNGSYFASALGVNDSPLVVGRGANPNQPARNVAIIYGLQTGFASEIPPLPGKNGGIAYAISANGLIVGASTLAQGAPVPFIRSTGGAVQAIPLPSGTTEGTARAVNTDAWVVGTASAPTTVPFLYDGTNTYRLADLIPSDSGWDLSTATGIGFGGVIVGTGVRNGQVRAFAMLPLGGVPAACELCHKDRQTIFTACNGADWRRHLAHGDYMGACVPLSTP